jgi:branched-chain amino acid transport system permease protein
LAGGLAGLSGAILAYYLAFVGPQDFDVNVSLLIFQMIVIGGMGSISGSVLGTILIIGVPEILRPLQDYRLGIGGALIVLMMILRPQGLVGTLRIRR